MVWSLICALRSNSTLDVLPDVRSQTLTSIWSTPPASSVSAGWSTLLAAITVGVGACCRSASWMFAVMSHFGPCTLSSTIFSAATVASLINDRLFGSRYVFLTSCNNWTVAEDVQENAQSRNHSGVFCFMVKVSTSMLSKRCLNCSSVSPLSKFSLFSQILLYHDNFSSPCWIQRIF